MATKKHDDEKPQAEALADANAEAEEKELDETIPGGRYLVDGVLKNAHGEPITSTGKVKE